MRVIVPCMNTHVVVDAIAEFAAGKRPVASELYITNADGVSVRYAMITAERNKKRRKNTKSAGTDLRLEERFIGFATSMHLGDPEPYSKRWDIETGYRMIEETRARTRSTKTVFRIFCFLYFVVMFDAWVMINAMLCAVSKPDRKTRKRMTQTQLQIWIIAVPVRHEPGSKTRLTSDRRIHTKHLQQTSNVSSETFCQMYKSVVQKNRLFLRYPMPARYRKNQHVL